jgi:rRNA maturation endonuclease Nob1
MSEERKPMLPDNELAALMGKAHDYTLAYLAGERVRNFYESKITSGELRVVEEVTYEDQCSACGNDLLEVAPSAGWFCPGCGNKIKR